MVDVNSHDIEHGGVKIVVSAARGAVMVAAAAMMLGGCGGSGSLAT